MKKKILIAILLSTSIILLAGCGKKKESATKTDPYKNYKTYNCDNVFTYKVPKLWKHEKN